MSDIDQWAAKELHDWEDVLWFVYHEDPTTEGHMASVRRKCPVLAQLTDVQIRVFVTNTHRKLETIIAEAARRFSADAASPKQENE